LPLSIVTTYNNNNKYKADYRDIVGQGENGWKTCLNTGMKPRDLDLYF
jgi:hypothetical protein